MAILVMGIGTVVAQTKKATPQMIGIVTDAFGKPIVGAEIHLLFSDNMAVSNHDGKFEFMVLQPGAVFQVSKPGYETTSVSLTKADEIMVTLKKDVAYKDLAIQGVYGQRAAQSVTSAIATVSGEELNKTPYLNLAAALVGRLPGLIVRQTDAEPGSETFALNIRGIGTPNGRGALILIDGVRSNELQSINPRDVESVTIYKDAATNVLYGMQGGNGIISVVTKTGDFGKPRITVSASNSYQQPIKTPDMINSWEYAALTNQAYKNDGQADFFKYSAAEIDSFAMSNNKMLYPNNNWYKAFMQPMVQTQQYNISAIGGIAGLKYYSNVGYSRVGSPYKADVDKSREQSIDRFNFRSNVDVKLNKNISAYMKISGQVSRTNGSINSAATILNSVFAIPPTIYGPLTPDSQVVSTPQETSPTYGLINRAGNIKQTSTRMNAIMGVKFDLGFVTKGLSAEAMAMFDAAANSTISGRSDYERWTRDLTRMDTLRFIKQGTQLETPLSLTKGSNSSYMSNVNAALKYQRTFDDHAVEAFTFFRYQYENRASLTLDGILPYQRITYGGQLNYAYSNLLFAELSASYEGSEQFHKENRFGLFPAASAAYVISNHDFLKDNSIITNLRLRASTGVVGNDQLNIGRFLYKDNIAKSGSKYIGALPDPINEVQKGNKLLTWEKSHKSNIGLELALWNEITFGVDLFYEDRTDIVTSANSIPAIQGLAAASLAPVNLGRVENKGFEIQLGYNKTFNKDFSMNINGYVDFNKNTVLESDELPLGEGYKYQYREIGYSMSQNWGYLIDKSNGNGYFNSAEEIVNSGLTYEGRAPRPGDFIYQDLNGDKIIDDKDIAPIGHSFLPQISWGVNMNFMYKNFDLSVLLQGVNRVSQFYSGLGIYEYVNGGTYFDMHRNAWTPERYAAGEMITAPALSVTQSASHRANDFYNQNKQYARLKNVEFGYQLPSNWAKLIKTDVVRIFVQGNNLFTFDSMKFNDMDLENSFLSDFQIARTINVGLNVTF